MSRADYIEHTQRAYDAACIAYLNAVFRDDAYRRPGDLQRLADKMYVAKVAIERVRLAA